MQAQEYGALADSRLTRFASHLHHNLIGLIVIAYLLAGLVPNVGLTIRSTSLNHVAYFGYSIHITLPSLLLAVLLFNAGLGIDPGRITSLVGRNSWLFLTSLLASFLLPLLYILALSGALQFWHSEREAQAILVGLALIASMPIAGSSTAWSQNSNGDLAMSLGLVIGSTLLSPLITPVVLYVAGWVTSGDYAESLNSLAMNGTSSFLFCFVMLPSLLGIATRFLWGEERLRSIKSHLRIINVVVLLILCYSNASLALPSTFSSPDWDFLLILTPIVIGLCVCGFLGGILLARFFWADSACRSSLMFGLGMTNNGTGLVFATTSLVHLPEVTLPIVLYNLVQHFVAGYFHRRLNA
jgi:BASS family bile acid:Na+ symporter